MRQLRERNVEPAEDGLGHGGQLLQSSAEQEREHAPQLNILRVGRPYGSIVSKKDALLPESAVVAGVEAMGPSARMVSPSMTTTPLGMAAPAPVQTVPPTNATGGAAAKAADQHRQPDRNKAIPRITALLQVQPTASTGQATLPNGTAADAAKGPKRASRALPHPRYAA